MPTDDGSAPDPVWGASWPSECRIRGHGRHELRVIDAAGSIPRLAQARRRDYVTPLGELAATVRRLSGCVVSGLDEVEFVDERAELFVGSVGVDREGGVAEVVGVERQGVAVFEAGCPP